MDTSLVPRALLGAVDGVGIVAVGALQLARDVLLSTVSGAADVGAEAVTATVSGARGVVSAASRMIGNVAGTAQSTVMATIDNARHARRGPARLMPAPSGSATAMSEVSASSSADSPRPRRRSRSAASGSRPSAAA